ncbi:unnamed protein product [Malus baccata var. baccata]
MSLKEKFDEYIEKTKTLPESTSNENKFIIYGLCSLPKFAMGLLSHPLAIHLDLNKGLTNLHHPNKWEKQYYRTKQSRMHERLSNGNQRTMGDYITKLKLLEEAGAST